MCVCVCVCVCVLRVGLECKIYFSLGVMVNNVGKTLHQSSPWNDSKSITHLIKSYHGQVSLVQSFESEPEDTSEMYTLEM